VSGVTVVKNVTRQTWRNENLTGSYYGGDSGEQTQCGTDNGHWETQAIYQITHNSDNSIAVRITDAEGGVATVTGTYSQFGHMGQIAGSGALPNGMTATVSMFEIERTISGITGRGHWVLRQGGADVCVWDGRWGGVRR
jgi:hypothetical protein